MFSSHTYQFQILITCHLLMIMSCLCVSVSLEEHSIRFHHSLAPLSPHWTTARMCEGGSGMAPLAGLIGSTMVRWWHAHQFCHFIYLLICRGCEVESLDNVNVRLLILDCILIFHSELKKILGKYFWEYYSHRAFFCQLYENWRSVSVKNKDYIVKTHICLSLVLMIINYNLFTHF